MSKKTLTQQQAQETWDKIREQVRLAPFNDEGISLPDIDMAKIFRGRNSLTWEKVTQEVTSIIENWLPSTEE